MYRLFQMINTTLFIAPDKYLDLPSLQPSHQSCRNKVQNLHCSNGTRILFHITLQIFAMCFHILISTDKHHAS